MVSDYATKSIVLVDFRAIAIAVPLPGAPSTHLNARLFNNLGDFDPVSEADSVHWIAVSWRNSAPRRISQRSRP